MHLLPCCSVRLVATPWTADPRLPCPSVSQNLLKLISIESVMLSNSLILCHPLLLLPSIFPSIRVFSNAGTEKPDAYCPSLPHVVTINGFQVLLSSITCLPSYPIGGEKALALLFPPLSIPASSNQQMP